MSDTTEGQEQEQEQTQETEQEQQAEPTPQEVEARKMGWKSEEDWDEDGSDRAKWIPAEEFNERNKRLKDRGDKILKAEISSLTRKVSSMERTLGDAAEHLKKADARAYQKALKEIEVKADKAVEDGDTDAYRRAKGEMKELEQEVKAETKTTPAPVPKDDPVFDSWLADNAWYDPKDDGFDAEIAAFADFIAKQIGRTSLTGTAFYNRMTAEVKKKFPDHFGNQRRRQAPAVEGAGGGGGNGKTLWSQVPKDARTEFKRFVGEGFYKDDNEGREKYADIYING
jgi:hypothetical protein